MSQLVPSSPLMHPVQYQGQTYYTSQYFHQQYLANSPHGGKYKRYDSFMRMLRSIEAYDVYKETRAIIECDWTRIKADEPQICGSFKALFQAAGWNAITLMDAVAQAALSHHLDDAISKQMSVAINTTVARQVSRRTADLLPDEVATRKLSARLDAGKLLGAPLYIAQQEAVKAVRADTGIDFRPLLQAAPAQDRIAPEVVMLEPNDLARELGLGEHKGVVLNKHLESWGWQVKKIGGGWEPTPTGKLYCVMHAWSSEHGTKSGHNLKWYLAAVRTKYQDVVNYPDLQVGVVDAAP